jgi:hypothetical protein
MGMYQGSYKHERPPASGDVLLSLSLSLPLSLHIYFYIHTRIAYSLVLHICIGFVASRASPPFICLSVPLSLSLSLSLSIALPLPRPAVAGNSSYMFKGQLEEVDGCFRIFGHVLQITAAVHMDSQRQRHHTSLAAASNFVMCVRGQAGQATRNLQTVMQLTKQPGGPGPNR